LNYRPRPYQGRALATWATGPTGIQTRSSTKHDSGRARNGSSTERPARVQLFHL